MKYLFVLNPYITKDSIKDIETSLNKIISKNKYEIIAPSSTAKLEKEIKTKIENNDFSTVVAVGGDGTISLVIRAILAFPDIKLGIIPQGTGNLLAANLGIPSNIERALEIVFSGYEKRIDLGTVNNHPFTIMIGIGFLSEIIEDIKNEEKSAFGVWSYFLKGLEHLYSAKEYDFHIIADGEKINIKSIGIFVANAGNFLAPCPTLLPDAEPTDEYLDVGILSLKSLKEDPIGYFELLVRYLTRNLRENNKLITFKAKEIIVDSASKLKVQADGDIVSELPVKISILPKKLRILVPQQPTSVSPAFSYIKERIEELFKKLLFR